MEKGEIFIDQNQTKACTDGHTPVVHADDTVGEPHYLYLPVAVGSGEVVQNNNIVSEGEEELVYVGKHHHVRHPCQPGASTIQLQ